MYVDKKHSCHYHFGSWQLCFSFCVGLFVVGSKSIRGCINAVYMCIVLCLYLFTVIFFLLCYAIMLYRCPDIELLCVILSTNRKRHICTPWDTTNICINIQTPHLSIVHLREKKTDKHPHFDNCSLSKNNILQEQSCCL